MEANARGGERRTPIIVRQTGFRTVDLEELVAAAGGHAALGAVPIDQLVDTAQFADDIANGTWGPSHGEIWRRAQDIKALLHGTESPRLIYAGGMPEVAHAVAFGAYLDDTWPVEPYDFFDGRLGWPEQRRTLELSTGGLPADRMTTAGPAVLRVEISYRVEDAQVREFVPEEEQVADIRIAPRDADPRTGLVQSLEDVDEVRRTVRDALFKLVTNRPGTTVIHLFIAAPVSACVVTGQELRLRNHPPVQTYRHRQREGIRETTEAIRLSSAGPDVADVPLTEEQLARASVLRQEVWGPAVIEVERFADRAGGAVQPDERGGRDRRWYDGLLLAREFQRLRPFPALPPVSKVVARRALVDPESFPDPGFGFIRTTRTWRVNDGFSVGLEQRFGDVETMKTLVRIFLLHEYLHEVHGINKSSFREVGKFPNALERADYMCDLYGVLHELELEAERNDRLRDDFDRLKMRVSELIDLVIRSYWVFEPPPPMEWMEVRRMRRYMNWYWQQARVEMATTPFELAAILARQPIVELAGFATRAEGRRYWASLRRLERNAQLEMCIVLDSEKLFRIQSSVNVPLGELVRAFAGHDHDQLKELFRRVYSDVEVSGDAQPREEYLP